MIRVRVLSSSIFVNLIVNKFVKRLRFKRFRHLGPFKLLFFESFFYRALFFTLLRGPFQNIQSDNCVFLIENDQLEVFKHPLKIVSLGHLNSLVFKNQLCLFFFPILNFYLKGIPVINVLQARDYNIIVRNLSVFELVLGTGSKRFDFVMNFNKMHAFRISGFLFLMAFCSFWLLRFNGLFNLNNFFNQWVFLIYKRYQNLCQLINS